MRISTAQMFQQRLTAMLEQQTKLSSTELQLASGKRLLSAADDPAASLRALQLNDRMSQIAQYQKNLDTATNRLVAEEGNLAAAGDVLQRVRELAIQAINGSLAQEDLNSIAVEARANVDGLLQIANSTDANGDYQFAGYQSDSPAFSHDGSGNFTYNGDQGTHSIQSGPASQIAVSNHGAEVFLGVPATAGGTSSAFDILYDFVEALEAGTPTADTISDIDAAMDQILAIRASVGARLNSVDNRRDINDSFTLVLQQEHTTITELDYAEAVSRFNQQLLAFQASQQVFSKIQDLSLFNYI